MAKSQNSRHNRYLRKKEAMTEEQLEEAKSIKREKWHENKHKWKKERRI